MTNSRFVATAPIDPIAQEILEREAPFHLAPASDVHTLMGLLEGTVGIVCRGEGKVTRGVVEASDQLRVIGRPGVGYDSVDIAAATERRIPVIYSPVGTFAVAEGALAMLLACVKRITVCHHTVCNNWDDKYTLNIGDLTEQTLGIVGMGRIGAHFAKLIQPFQMKVLGHDPFVDAKAMDPLGVEKVELDDLLGRSDYVSLHIPLTEQTDGLINRQRIASMKRGAILINLARGRIIKSLDVLADALESGQLSAVGLDVFPTEPPDGSHRIFKDPRLTAAPHMLGVTVLAWTRICRSMAHDMVAVVQKRRPQYCVNPEVL